MDPLIFSDAFLQNQAIETLLALNEVTQDWGLRLSPAQALSLVKAREEALISTGRIELGSGCLEKLILAFYDSPYLPSSQAIETLEDLLQTFYYFKNESFESLTDEELLKVMREKFDGECHGSVALLQGKSLTELVQFIHGLELADEKEDQEWEDDDFID